MSQRPAIVVDILAVDGEIEGTLSPQMQELAHQIRVGVGHIDIGTGSWRLLNHVPRNQIGTIVGTAERIERQRLSLQIGAADGSRNAEIVTESHTCILSHLLLDGNLTRKVHDVIGI